MRFDKNGNGRIKMCVREVYGIFRKIEESGVTEECRSVVIPGYVPTRPAELLRYLKTCGIEYQGVTIDRIINRFEWREISFYNIYANSYVIDPLTGERIAPEPETQQEPDDGSDIGQTHSDEP